MPSHLHDDHNPSHSRYEEESAMDDGLLTPPQTPNKRILLLLPNPCYSPVIGDEIQPAFTRIVSRRRVIEEAETMTEKLEKIMPRQQVEIKIQAKAFGRIVASRSLKAFRKDVTGHLYGDVS